MNFVKKVSASQVEQFAVRFHKESKYKNLRFGQAFLNEFYPELAFSELFYQEDERRAKIIIYANLVDFTKGV